MQSINPVWKWIVSLRMYSLPFVMLPYSLGLLVAFHHDGHGISWGWSLAGFLPVILIHLAANLQSDIFDYLKGIDVEPHRFSGGIIRKWITVREATFGVLFLYVTSMFVGFVILYGLGWIMLPFCILGLFLSIFYSAGNKFAFKYNVTGEWFIFLGFGFLIPEYAYVINTGQFSFLPLVFSLPAAFLIAAIKHANNWIAVLTPGNLEKNTSAYLLGGNANRVYFCILIGIPYLVTGSIIYWQDLLKVHVPGSLFIIFTTLPLFAILLVRSSKAFLVNPENRLLGLDSITAVYYSLFIFLCCASFIIG